MSSLHDRLDEFRMAFESGVPPYNAPQEAIEMEPEFRLPIAARYVIDKQGIIRAADVNADYTTRPEPSETIKHLRALTA